MAPESFEKTNYDGNYYKSIATPISSIENIFYLFRLQELQWIDVIQIATRKKNIILSGLQLVLN